MVAEAPRFSALVIGTVLVLSALFSMSIIPSNSSAHMTNHETITITGNLDLTAANGVTGGSGSEADPFTIEGWEIVFESGTGISISSTTAHLAIRNVHIVDLFYGSSGGGIELRYAENVRVENATIDVYVNDYGQSPLLVDHCKNVTISNCTLDPRPYSPVYVWFSQNVTVEHCFIGPQGGGDLYFSSTSDFIVRGNTFYGADGGVACYNSENGTILENDFWLCYRPIGFQSSHDIRCYHNSYFQYWTEVGWPVSMCYNISFHNGYPDGGSYYEYYNATDHKSGPAQDQAGEDGIADDPYQMGDMVDAYPLMTRYVAPKHGGDYIELYPGSTTYNTVENPKDVYAVPVDMNGLDRVASLTCTSNRTECTIEEIVTGDPWVTFRFTAHDDGYFELSVTDGNVTTHVLIHVNLGLSAIIISPASTSVAFGDSIQFTAVGYNMYGQVEIEPAWSSGQSTINQTGFFTATYYPSDFIHSATSIDPYSATITASQEGASGTATAQIQLSGLTDCDSDAMPDWWELKYSFDPFNASDTVSDPDGDGLQNLQEYLNGTLPRNADSDADAVPDGWEVANGFDPLNGSDGALDADADGLSNRYEYLNGTDPRNPDTDTDGMADGFEYYNYLDPHNPADAALDKDSDGLTNLQEFENSTSPSRNDTDFDFMPDLWEILNGLNPVNSSDKWLDKEGDALSNYMEFVWGTDPSNPDCDSDGLPDGFEAGNYLNPLDPSDASDDDDDDGLTNIVEYGLGTNLGNNDTDSDYMPDGWEFDNEFDPGNSSDAEGDADEDLLQNSLEYAYGTDPHNADTDADSVSDGLEAGNLMDPLDPMDIWLDFDLDGVNNLNEILAETILQDADSDDDQLGDGFELIFSKTNPNAWDTDGDGLGDAVEFVLSQGYTGELTGIPYGWMGITIDCGNYSIEARTNSSVLEGGYDKDTQKMTLKVSGPNGTMGALDLTVPKSLCNASDITLMLDNAQLNFTLTQNETHYVIHAEYAHSSHTVVAQFLASADTEEPSDDDGLGAYAIYIGGAVAAILVVAAAIVLIMRKRKPA